MYYGLYAVAPSNWRILFKKHFKTIDYDVLYRKKLNLAKSAYGHEPTSTLEPIDWKHDFPKNWNSYLQIKRCLRHRIPHSRFAYVWHQIYPLNFTQSKCMKETRFNHLFASLCAFFTLLLQGTSDRADFWYTTVFQYEESEFERIFKIWILFFAFTLCLTS